MAPVFYALASLKARLAETDKERGATAVEYGVIVALISVVLIVALVALVEPATGLLETAITSLFGSTS